MFLIHGMSDHQNQLGQILRMPVLCVASSLMFILLIVCCVVYHGTFSAWCPNSAMHI